MRVLIIAPPNDFRGLKKKYSMENRIVPLILARIGAVLEKSHVVKIIDGLALNLTKDEIINEVNGFNPGLILISAFDRCRWGLNAALDLFGCLKGRKGMIWSHYADILEEIMKDNHEIDFAVYGDPEFTLEEYLRKGENVNGLIYRKGNKIIRNKARELIDINRFPVPARHLLNMDLYKRFPHENKHSKVIDLNVSMGCPYHCTYCINKLIHGRTYRVRNVDLVIDEVKSLIDDYRIKELHFMDPVFTMNKKWVKGLCSELRMLNLDWSCQTRADLVDKELLGVMKDAGCFSILFGVESLNQNLLDNIQKDIKVNSIEDAVNLCKGACIETRLSFMVGLPGETPEIFKRTVEHIIKLNPDFVQFHSVVAFPGTDLYDLRHRFGDVRQLKAKKYDLSGNLFIPKGYKDEEEIRKMQKYAYRRFYLRFGYLMTILRNPGRLFRYVRGFGIFMRLLSE